MLFACSHAEYTHTYMYNGVVRSVGSPYGCCCCFRSCFISLNCSFAIDMLLKKKHTHRLHIIDYIIQLETAQINFNTLQRTNATRQQTQIFNSQSISNVPFAKSLGKKKCKQCGKQWNYRRFLFIFPSCCCFFWGGSTIFILFNNWYGMNWCSRNITCLLLICGRIWYILIFTVRANRCQKKWRWFRAICGETHID